MIRLVTLTLRCPPLNGLYNVTTIQCADPDPRIRGWRACIRGPAVFLVSPRGWRLSIPEPLWDPNGTRKIHEIPRADCVLQWASDDDIAVDKLQKFDSEPFAKPAAAVPPPLPLSLDSDDELVATKSVAPRR